MVQKIIKPQLTFQYKRHCESPTVTTGSLEISTVLVLFSFVCIFVILGLSVWVTKLTKRLKELEGQRLRNQFQSHNSSMNSYLYEINNQNGCSTQRPFQSYSATTVKVLPTNESPCQDTKSTHNFSTNSNCGHCGRLSSQLVQLSSIIDETLNTNSSFR